MIRIVRRYYYDETLGDAVFKSDNKYESTIIKDKMADIIESCDKDILSYMSMKGTDYNNKELRAGINRILKDYTNKLNEEIEKRVCNFENLYILLIYDFKIKNCKIKMMYIDKNTILH